MINIDAIPAALRARPQWVCWKRETRNGRMTKVPYQPANGREAAATRPHEWATFDAAYRRFLRGGYDGIGFVLTPEDPFSGLDLDHCRDPETGRIEDWAVEIIREMDSYSEITPSGTGIRIFVKGKLPAGGRKRGNIEIYDAARYLTVTGNHLPGTPEAIEQRQRELAALHARIFQERRSEGRPGLNNPRPQALESGDAEILEKARNAANGARFRQLYDGGNWAGYPSRSEADSALCAMLAFYCRNDERRVDGLFRRSKLFRGKWDSRRGETTYGAQTVRRACALAGRPHHTRVSTNQPPAVSASQFPALEREAIRHEDLPGPQPSPCATEQQGVRLEDFWAYMPMHTYIFAPGRDLWPAASVNARIALEDPTGNPVKASAWLDTNQPVEQMTWAPGEPMLIRDRLISEGGWIERRGCTCFNLYRPPQAIMGNPSQAGPWLNHVSRVYGADAGHIVAWLAHRVQRPREKINHALVLGGPQGIGKDTLLEPVKHAVGPWNFCEVSPTHLLGRFNGWVKSVILRVSEARDLGDIDRYGFYDHLKAYTAAPPDVLRCDEKNIREYSVLNVCGVIITTNHKTDGIYLPADDRRHYVAWSDCTKEDFREDYWKSLYAWYEGGGYGHVAAYLRDLDISSFDAKAPPPKTDAFWAIVDANRAPEDAELSDALDALGNPDAVTISDIMLHATSDFAAWLRDRKNSRQIPHRMEAVGYVPVRNPGQKRDGLWKIGSRSQVVYARRDLCVRERLSAAIGLTRQQG